MHKLWRFLLSVLLVLALGFGVARATAIRVWRTPDNDPYLEASIAPTLRGGDWLVLWRFTPPHVGDLVLCPEPNHPERVVIGRMAAVEEDTIETAESDVSLNGRRAAASDSCAENKFTSVDPETHVTLEQRCTLERLGSRVHMRGDVALTPPAKVWSTPIGKGQAFLLSDNRQFPYDSRDFGPVQREGCKETIVLRILGKSGFGDVASRLTLIR